MGSEVELEHGRRGQFDILVGGRVVVTRKGGLLARLFKKPWPDADDVVATVREATRQPAG